MKDLVIFGTGQVAEVIHYYFTEEGGRKVAAFTVDAKYRTTEELLGLPVVPFEELDDLSAGRLVGPHYVAQVFGVQVCSERRGIDQVAKHDRELTAFGHVSRAFSERDGCLMRPGESPIMPLLGRGRASAAHLYRERSATSPAELEERWIREPAVQTALLERNGTRAAELRFLRVVRAAAWTAHARIPLGDDLRSGILAGHRSMVKHARVGLNPLRTEPSSGCSRGGCAPAPLL